MEAIDESREWLPQSIRVERKEPVFRVCGFLFCFFGVDATS